MRTSPIGYRLALLAAVISGVSIYVSSFAVRVLPDATLYTTLKNAVTGLLLLVPVVVLARGRAELLSLSRRDAAWLAAIAVVGGSVPYVLFFTGLQMTTAATGSLLNHAQFLVVVALAVPLLRERLTPAAWIGLALLAAGSVAGTDAQALRVNAGAALVLASTVMFGAGMVMARHLLARVSAELVMSAKMSAGAGLLVAYAWASGHLGSLGSLSATQWAVAVGTGLILLAFTVATTYALCHAPAVSVAAIGMASPPITLALQLAAGSTVHFAAGAAWSTVLVVAGASLFLAAGRPRPAPVTA